MIKALQKRLDTDESGFTLVELLVVMIIIAILMAIAVPIFLSQKNKANATGAKSTAKNIGDWLDSCAASDPSGSYAACTAAGTGDSLKQDEPGLWTNQHGSVSYPVTNTIPGDAQANANQAGFTVNGTVGYTVAANTPVIGVGNQSGVVQFTITKSGLGTVDTCSSGVSALLTQLCPSGHW